MKSSSSVFEILFDKILPVVSSDAPEVWYTWKPKERNKLRYIRVFYRDPMRDSCRKTTWWSLILSTCASAGAAASVCRANVTALNRYIDGRCHATADDILHECIIVSCWRSACVYRLLCRADRSVTDEPRW